MFKRTLLIERFSQRPVERSSWQLASRAFLLAVGQSRVPLGTMLIERSSQRPVEQSSWQSPCDHQSSDSLGSLATPRERFSRNHLRCVWRVPSL